MVLLEKPDIIRKPNYALPNRWRNVTSLEATTVVPIPKTFRGLGNKMSKCCLADYSNFLAEE